MSRILALNTGSSSVKFALAEGDDISLRGQISQLPDAPVLELREANEESRREPLTDVIDQAGAVSILLDRIDAHTRGQPLDAVGHRVVHGGPFFDGPARVTDDVLRRIRQLVPLAPLHQPSALEAIDAVARRMPGVLQTGSFDTSFHRSQEPHVQLYALPEDYTRRGILRYGFHGLSYDHVSSEVARLLPDINEPRIVAAHLGSGASLCAIRGRRSVATSMGFSALEGLPMATRCGNLDPGALLFLITQEGLDPDAIERTLYRDSGLKGLSGLDTGDIRELIQRGDEPGPARALAHFVHRIQLGIGEMAAALGGVDALVFTGGIGENAPVVRERIIDGLSFLGFECDRSRNTQGTEQISGSNSRHPVFLVKADEESIILRDAQNLLASRI